MTHSNSSLISDRTNGDVSSDFYHLYPDDIQFASNIGLNMIKISLSWSRILPDGNINRISDSGISFYNRVIDEMLANNITPMISLFDGDMPYFLQKLGGWTDPEIVDVFVEYASVAFMFFGDRVKYWVTIAEPTKICRFGYGGIDIPAMNMPGVADYLCGHHMLLAHSKVYELYHQEYNPQGNNGKLGIINYYTWFVPERNTSELDVAAAERAHKFYNDWLTYPIFSQTGDYPEIMQLLIDYKSYIAGFPLSRLPVFSPPEIERIRGSADFLGINYYTATSVEDYNDDTKPVSFDKDADIRQVETDRWIGETKIKITPWGLTKLLHRLNNDYLLPEIWITNGYADSGSIMDWGRVVYHHKYLKAVLKAMQDGIDIQGYLVKSLTDGFEEMDGYKMKFGLFHVAFNTSDRTRLFKLSTVLINDVAKTRIIRPLKEVYADIEKFAKQLEISKIVEFIVEFEQWDSALYPSF
ncbi:myrosinase 1 isoform X2 [Linepithema humile]|nr:PREDICTED: myrosinase 1 isoform X2 [Linepithema humile]XP_012229658.1 PREDICTED: myrosinase 1 isoform X2 [Linepithema humile]